MDIRDLLLSDSSSSGKCEPQTAIESMLDLQKIVSVPRTKAGRPGYRILDDMLVKLSQRMCQVSYVDGNSESFVDRNDNGGSSGYG
jgi:hypothetical protein